MIEINKNCPKCDSTDIALNSQVNPAQDLIPGKAIKIEIYPKYLCKACSTVFDE